MTLTDYQAKYIATELTRRFPPDSVEKIAATLVDAQVDLNPHQIDAALFAFRSPLSRGALLADEVGLGKTIEAGLVLSQKWAERKRRILVITPSNLRKQWYQELNEKFFLPCRLLESKSYNAAVKQGFQRMVEGCAINGNPKPELKEMTGAFVVKFTRRPVSEGINEGINGGVNEGISQLLEYIQKNPAKRVVEIAAAVNVPSKTIERWIKKLREQGEIVFSGPRKSGGYFVSR